MMAERGTFDEKLIARIAQGERAAFAQVYEATKSSVYGFALSILRNRADAEDVMHDAYLKMYQSAGSYRPKGKPMAWLLTIVKRLAYNRIRSRRHEAAPLQEPAADSIPKEDGQIRQAEDRLVLNAALDLLDVTDRQIVILHALTGMKHREIAQLLEMPLSTCLSKYRRALEKMRNKLEERGEYL